MSSMNEKLVFSGVIEEYKNGMDSSSHWHFSCGKCGQKMRCQAVPAGLTSDFDCPECKTQIRVLNDGRVFRITAESSTSLTGGNEYSEYHCSVENIQNTSRKNPNRTGLLNRFANKLKDAEEESAGRKLREGLLSTGDNLQSLDDGIRSRALQGFLQKTYALERDLPNWSREGRIKIGRSLQQEAKKKFDFNQAESYALWLAGAWLESRERETLDASFVHQALRELINEIEK